MRGTKLIKKRGFIGLLITMFAGATNDNLVKTAFIVAITALSWDVFTLNSVILANAAALCFILPFIVLAGFSAHQAIVQPPKRWLMTLKIIELGLAIISGCAIYYELGWLLLLCIAGFGVQSALIGPLKYALIPKLAEQSDLLNKNAWMESATFVAILVGTLVASDWIIDAHIQLIALTIVLASAGIAGVLPLPMFDGRPGNAKCSIKDLVHKQRQDVRSMSAIWCISGFWGVGSVWLTHLPMLAVDVWDLSPRSIGTLLSYFVLGITLGAFTGVLLKNRQITIRILAGASMMVFGALMMQRGHYEMAAALGLILTSAGGGFLALPLYTLLQDDQMEVANRIAVNNIANAMMIVGTAVASLLTVGLFGLNLLLWLLILSLGQLFLCLHHRRNLGLS
jgi:MFS family permease